VDRIIDVFPADQQPQIRSMLADCLQGVVSQLLLRTATGEGRVAVHEILIGCSGLSASIRSGKIASIRNVIQSGKGAGMQLMDDALEAMVNQGKVTGHDAYMKAGDKSRFEHHMEREF
jgi:twitching motility protein PilT